MFSTIDNEKVENVVFNWKERTSTRQKKFTSISALAFIIVAVICVISLSYFESKNYERVVNQNMNYIQDSTLQKTNQFEQNLNFGVDRIEKVAEQYAVLLNNTDRTMDDILALYQNKTFFTHISYISSDGMYMGRDVSDSEVFIRGMGGLSGYIDYNLLESTDQNDVVFYAPIKSDTGENVAVLIGTLDNEEYNELLTYQLFNLEPNTYLLNRDGTVIAKSSSGVDDINVLDRLSTKQFVGDIDFNEIQSILDDSKRTIVTFSFIEDKDTSVGTIVQFNNNNWMILSVLGKGVVTDVINSANRTGLSLLITVSAMFVLLFVWLIYSFYRQKRFFEMEIEYATQNLKENIEEEKKQLSIIGTLVDIYSSVYYTDVSTMTYIRLKENLELDTIVASEGDTQQAHTDYVDKFVVEGDRPEMYDFLNTDTVAERLRRVDSINHEYRRVNKGWHRATLAAASRDENGEVTAFVLAVQMIDEEKTKELETKEALRQAYESSQLASRAKSTFLSNMSHDIRTPMNAIIGMTAIAAANLGNTDKVADCLSKITSSSKHLLGLINEVLDMSKIESGKVDLSEENFTLPDIMNNLLSLNKPLADAKNHTINININNVVHENVIGDSVRLQQVFTNLLSNAIKYTPDNGKIDITLTEKNTNKDKIGWFEVVFKDNGIGMTEEFASVMFEPFSRANDERISEIQGTGLGMPIARNIIRMMNGDITVESKINEGSTFTVSFALKLQEDGVESYERFVDLNILVVDDDEFSCESACLICDSLGMKSEYVTNGAEAVDKVVARHETDDDYYAVIIDWKMPDMDGVETTRQIRKRVGRDVPIIVISSYDWTEIEQEARAAGADAFLGKPLFKSRVVNLFNDLSGESSHTEAPDIKAEMKKHDFSGKRILLVEDNAINREITIELLSMLGIETDIAENGKIGVDKFQQSEKGYYDLIFMDIQMPVMNGYESTMAIRELEHPDAKLIPIVAMTANAFASDVRAAYDSGMNAHISKPIDIDKVIETLYNLTKNNN